MAKPSIDATDVVALIGRHFDRVGGVTQLVEGEDSRAFAFEADGEFLVIRINQDIQGFEKDRLAHRNFSRPGLPIPEILQTGPTGFGGYFCVSRRADGETLQALPPGEAYAYGAAIGRLLDALGDLDPGTASGYGPFDAGGRARYEHWADYLAGDWNWDRLSPGTRGGPVRELAAELRLRARHIPDRRGIVHGDFGANNVLVADGEVTALLDWSDAIIGDPLYDVANILFWRPWLDCMEQQCRYFEREEPGRLDDRAALTCYQLRIGLETLREALEALDQRVADWALDRCQTILAGD